MKKSNFIQAFCAFITLCLCASINAQTIRRCNNNPGVTGVNMYTTLQVAHDNANIGDIIYVEPSSSNYGSLTCSKRLTIIGNGYFLSSNPNTPSEKQVSRVGNITFNSGSAQSSVSGMSADGIFLGDVNITVSRCYVGFSGNGVRISANNGTVKNCFIARGGIDADNTKINALIIGNIIFKPEQGAINNITNGTIANNIIYSDVTGYFGSGNPLPAAIQNAGNCIITNNIFDFRNSGVSAQAIGCSNQPCVTTNTVSNNICLTRSGLPAGNGNVNGAIETTVFSVTNPWNGFNVFNTDFTQDVIFQLAVGSPAIGIGTGGTNAGAFGGPSPYVLSGMPAYPVITNYTVSGVGNTSVPLNVSVTVRGNN